MAKTPYWQKLKDPRWQKVRLEVMNRDAFTCQECQATTKTLNVHHRYYFPGREPWDYPLSALVTLCEGCHENPSIDPKHPHTWELYIELENQTEELDTRLPEALLEHAAASGLTPSSLLALIANAVRYDLIDHETVARWRHEIKEIDAMVERGPRP